MPNLQSLALGGGHPLPDLGPVNRHPHLTHLHLSGNDRVVLTPLAGRKRLTIKVAGKGRKIVQAKLGAGSKVVKG